MIKESNILVEAAMREVLQSVEKLERVTGNSLKEAFDAYDAYTYDGQMLNNAIKKWYGLTVIRISADTINRRVVVTLSDDSKHYAQF